MDFSQFQRIAILGISCSGKSTLADQISKKYQIPALHLDQIAFLDGTNWQMKDLDSIREEQQEFLKQNNQWIIEGNYSFCLDERLKRADCIIWLDIPFHTFLFRIIKREFFTPQTQRLGQIQDGKQNLLQLALYTFRTRKKKAAHYKNLAMQYPQATFIHIKKGKPW